MYICPNYKTTPLIVDGHPPICHKIPVGVTKAQKVSKNNPKIFWMKQDKSILGEITDLIVYQKKSLMCNNGLVTTHFLTENVAIEVTSVKSKIQMSYGNT